MKVETNAERRRRADRDAKDLEILNRSADALNKEVEDILKDQVEPSVLPRYERSAHLGTARDAEGTTAE